MKKLTLGLITVFMLFFVGPLQLKADIKTNTVPTSSTATVKSVEADAMIIRLNEIKAMDVSALSSSEKKKLRKEVRSIKSELKVKSETTYIEGGHGGIYMSVGAAVVIALLLILLL